MVVRVIVVGAGIIGLSSAVAIQQTSPNIEVTIVAEKFGRHTTSDGAGGMFVPSLKVAANRDLYHSWASDGAKHFFDLAFSQESGNSGVNLVSGYCLFNSNDERPAYLDYMPTSTEMSPELLARFSRYYKYGYVLTTAIIEGPKYLPWLMKKFLSNGGKVVSQRINSFEELCGKCDIVVNCSGLGSKALTSDPKIQPSRGHILRVYAPWVKHFMLTDDERYILPASETTAVGGIYQEGRSDLIALPTDSEEIWQAVIDRFPALEGAKILWEWVGLRPLRESVRLEPETVQFSNGRQLKIIHNYGHGSNGISMSWGTGLHVARIVRQMVEARPRL